MDVTYQELWHTARTARLQKKVVDKVIHGVRGGGCSMRLTTIKARDPVRKEYGSLTEFLLDEVKYLDSDRLVGVVGQILDALADTGIIDEVDAYRIVTGVSHEFHGLELRSEDS